MSLRSRFRLIRALSPLKFHETIIIKKLFFFFEGKEEIREGSFPTPSSDLKESNQFWP